VALPQGCVDGPAHDDPRALGNIDVADVQLFQQVISRSAGLVVS
jgi:hypothetical protein